MEGRAEAEVFENQRQDLPYSVALTALRTWRASLEVVFYLRVSDSLDCIDSCDGALIQH